MKKRKLITKEKYIWSPVFGRDGVTPVMWEITYLSDTPKTFDELMKNRIWGYEIDQNEELTVDEIVENCKDILNECPLHYRHQAVKDSDVTLKYIHQKMVKDYGLNLSYSTLNRFVHGENIHNIMVVNTIFEKLIEEEICMGL